MSKISADQLWQFSLSIYADEQVQQTLLHWQNEYHLNVNVCLLLAYLDCHHVAISPSQLDKLQSSIHDFDHHALQPLRSVRRYLKIKQLDVQQYPQLRQQILNLELAFEQHQQQQLMATCQTLILEHKTQPHNLNLYLPTTLLPLKTDLDQALHAIQY